MSESHAPTAVACDPLDDLPAEADPAVDASVACEQHTLDTPLTPAAYTSGRVRIILRVRPLIRREYGYSLATEKVSHTKCVISRVVNGGLVD